MKPKLKRRRLDELEITAIAAVDFPAQEGATVAILKRRPSADDVDSDAILEKLLAVKRKADEAIAKADAGSARHKASMDEAVASAARRARTIETTRAVKRDQQETRTMADNNTISKRDQFMAKKIELMERNPDMTEFQAFQKVAQLHPDLAGYGAGGNFHRPQIDGKGVDASIVKKAREDAETARAQSHENFMQKCGAIQRDLKAQGINRAMHEIMSAEKAKG